MLWTRFGEFWHAVSGFFFRIQAGFPQHREVSHLGGSAAERKGRTLSRPYRKNSHGRASMTWYHYLWSQMASPKGRFADNRVSFVTLNYDRSLERYFFLCLKAQHGYRDDDACFKEHYGLRFVHVYGSLGDERFEESFNRLEPTPGEVQSAANRLRSFMRRQLKLLI